MMAATGPASNRVPARAPSVLAMLAVLGLFIAERLFTDGTGRLVVLTSAGVALVVAFALRVIEFLARRDDDARVVVTLLLPKIAVAVGALSYAAWRALTTPGVDDAKAALTGTGAGALLLLSLFFLALGCVTLVALEIALAPMRDAGGVERPRIRAASTAAASATVALFALGLLNFAAVRLDWRRDFSVNAPSAPSSSTLSLLEGAKTPVHITLFFERGSPALTEIRDYFDAMKARGATVDVLDHAFDPNLAAKLKVAKNGTVAIASGERSETWFVGTERDAVQRKAKKLDEEVRTRISKVTRDEKKIYFTSGHGERELKAARPGERPSVSSMKKLLEQLNTKVEPLGISSGLSEKVPDDAALVVIAGPTAPFLESEVAALVAYKERGGAFFILLDPGADVGLTPLLSSLAVAMSNEELVNDQEFVRQSHTTADHAFLYSASFTSHKAIRGLSSSRDKAALLFFSAGALKDVPTEGIRRTSLAKSRPGAFLDMNGDRAFQENKETRAVFDLAVAAEYDAKKSASDASEDPARELRAVIVADSDVVHDVLLGNQANRFFVDDAILWLLKDDVAGGAVASDDDVPIRHTRDGDVAWFYGSTFLAPILVLLGGLTYVARRRRRRT
jgi:hypothetical protein